MFGNRPWWQFGRSSTEEPVAPHRRDHHAGNGAHRILLAKKGYPVQCVVTKLARRSSSWPDRPTPAIPESVRSRPRAVCVAPRIRRAMPLGYTLPEFVGFRLGSERVHKLYLFPFFFYQLMAVTVQLFAGSNLVSLLTGIPLPQVMLLLSAVVLAYTLISGLEASIVTDFVQLGIIFVMAATFTKN